MSENVNPTENPAPGSSDGYPIGTCSLCGCLLRAKVHVSSEALKASTTKPEEEDIPDFCWLHEVYK